MKIKVGVGALLLLAILMSALPIMAVRPSSTPKAQKDRHHRKHGAEVGNRVRQLRRFNRNVDRAFGAFERNEHRNGHIITSNGRAVTFEKAAFTPQWNPFTLGQRIGGANPRLRQYVRCTWAASAAVGIGCGVAALGTGGAAVPSCLVQGVAIGNSGCGIAAIFRIV